MGSFLIALFDMGPLTYLGFVCVASVDKANVCYMMATQAKMEVKVQVQSSVGPVVTL